MFLQTKTKMTTIEETHDISKIEFGIYSSDEIRAMSVCKIDSKENKESNGFGTVYDPKMGSAGDSNQKCVTCGMKQECPGHFGYIELEVPCLHPMYYKVIANFLKCFCHDCHRLLITSDQVELSGLNRLPEEKKFSKIVDKLKKTDVCSHCSSPQPKICFRSKDMTITKEHKQKKGKDDEKSRDAKILLEVDDIKEIFDDICNEDVYLLGLNPNRVHPKNLIITALPVIPPCSRPFVVSDGNICDDDLTYQYLEIVKTNIQLKNNPAMDSSGKEGKKVQEKREKLIQTLKFRISTLFNNSKSRAKHPTDSRPLKGLKERLAGKQGRLRFNLMGKRTDFSARSVIGAEPTLKMNQLAIPYEVAQIHTKPENVTEHNIEWLSEIVNAGKANFLRTVKMKKDVTGEMIPDPAGGVVRINLSYGMYKRGTQLLYGDVIIRDEDIVLKETEGIRTIREVADGDEKRKVYSLPKKIEKSGKGIIRVLTGQEVLKKGDRLLRPLSSDGSEDVTKGAKTVGELIDVNLTQKKDIKLKVGDIVERQLIKGDRVLFNRQPTLHKGSMLAVEVVPMPNKSFRFNLCNTRTYNSDFDNADF